MDIHGVYFNLCIHKYCISLLIYFIRCYLRSGDIDRGHKVFEDYIKSGKFPNVELYVVSSIKIYLTANSSFVVLLEFANLKFSLSLYNLMSSLIFFRNFAFF